MRARETAVLSIKFYSMLTRRYINSQRFSQKSESSVLGATCTCWWQTQIAVTSMNSDLFFTSSLLICGLMHCTKYDHPIDRYSNSRCGWICTPTHNTNYNSEMVDTNAYRITLCAHAYYACARNKLRGGSAAVCTSCQKEEWRRE